MILVLGLGEDGVAGLNETARNLLKTADVLVGGTRHHALVPEFTGTRLDWSQGIDAGIDAIASHRETSATLVVIASGDPLYYGVGKALIARFGASHVKIIPAPGAVSLACAAMGWSQPHIQVVSLHGRPLENLNLYVTPGARIIALTQNGETPARVAALLTEQGFGPSRMTVLERLGGAHEHRLTGLAQAWPHPPGAALNTLALELTAEAAAKPYSRLAGLPDEAYQHDGQLTKRHMRAITLSSLAPLPGQTLWDLGAGAGSISIEWLRAHASNHAVAVERDPVRAERIHANAARLGVGRLHIEVADNLQALQTLQGSPQAIFIGGGVRTPTLLETAWAHLKPDGRLVANAVLDQSRAVLEGFQKEHGGTLTTITIEDKTPIHHYVGFKSEEKI